jgi:hypothetical protein
LLPLQAEILHIDVCALLSLLQQRPRGDFLKEVGVNPMKLFGRGGMWGGVGAAHTHGMYKGHRNSITATHLLEFFKKRWIFFCSTACFPFPFPSKLLDSSWA